MFAIDLLNKGDIFHLSSVIIPGIPPRNCTVTSHFPCKWGPTVTPGTVLAFALDKIPISGRNYKTSLENDPQVLSNVRQLSRLLT